MQCIRIALVAIMVALLAVLQGCDEKNSDDVKSDPRTPTTGAPANQVDVDPLTPTTGAPDESDSNKSLATTTIAGGRLLLDVNGVDSDSSNLSDETTTRTSTSTITITTEARSLAGITAIPSAFAAIFVACLVF
eukprot:TRINITY_DN43042_c0_g1_i1.p1 TRINITY_DN43042_c0_g1~~TRINITY_DN43042_c0_g1_i1.p1  ORF type:complete len:134 (-),score=20.29 TRINITY_DN43042_c0_g1_i1:457-858(-)